MKNFGIYVEDELIYKGDFSEVPAKYREGLISSLEEWADILGKKSINEFIYSSLYWYYEEKSYCNACEEFFDDEPNCANCDSGLIKKRIYDTNSKIDKILDCIGMITRVVVIK
ncbi:MAG: hypothetical protein GTN59_09290 [Candidatus Dadabacteria bacterium]|nr:hypothetical protein [Candidatus Dadabacteria bacterium]